MSAPQADNREELSSRAQRGIWGRVDAPAPPPSSLAPLGMTRRERGAREKLSPEKAVREEHARG
jgi:hypothetical protein